MQSLKGLVPNLFSLAVLALALVVAPLSARAADGPGTKVVRAANDTIAALLKHLFPSPDGVQFTAQANQGDPAFDMVSHPAIFREVFHLLDGDKNTTEESLIAAFLPRAFTAFLNLVVLLNRLTFLLTTRWRAFLLAPFGAFRSFGILPPRLGNGLAR